MPRKLIGLCSMLLLQYLGQILDVYSKVKCWKLSYMKLLFNRMNLTAASLNNIQNENSVRPMMVVFFIHVLFTDNTKTYPCLIIILIPEIDWQAKIYYRIKNMIQTFLTLRIHVIIWLMNRISEYVRWSFCSVNNLCFTVVYTVNFFFPQLADIA